MNQTAPILPGLGICIRSTAPRRLSDVGSVKSKFTVRACPMLHSSRPPASHQNAAHRAAGHSAGRLVSPVDCEPNAKAGGSLWIIWQPRSKALSRASIDCKDVADSTTSELAGCGLEFFSGFAPSSILKVTTIPFERYIARSLNRSASFSSEAYRNPIQRIHFR